MAVDDVAAAAGWTSRAPRIIEPRPVGDRDAGPARDAHRQDPTEPGWVDHQRTRATSNARPSSRSIAASCFRPRARTPARPPSDMTLQWWGVLADIDPESRPDPPNLRRVHPTSMAAGGVGLPPGARGRAQPPATLRTSPKEQIPTSGPGHPTTAAAAPPRSPSDKGQTAMPTPPGSQLGHGSRAARTP
jgi:hypothetical protein